MRSELSVLINGKHRSFSGLLAPTTLADLMVHLGLKADRIAIELNGEIAPRAQWTSLTVSDGDKLEVVHFIGGGLA